MSTLTNNTIIAPYDAYSQARKSWDPVGKRITSVIGAWGDGNIIELNGVGFSAKTNAKPLYFWRADEGGVSANQLSTLGRKTAWDFGPNGAKSSAVVAPNSDYSWLLDHGSDSNAILGGITSDFTELFVWRRTHDAYTYAQVTILFFGYTGTQPDVGRVIKGQTSLATGVVSIATGSRLDFSHSGGTINDGDGPYHSNGETCDIYADGGGGVPTGGSLGTLVVNQSGGLQNVYNHKIFRIWSTAAPLHTIHYQSLFDDETESANVQAESTDSQYDFSPAARGLSHVPNQWNVEHFIYQLGTLNTADGVFEYYLNGVGGWSPDHLFIMKDDTYNSPYRTIYHNQVSGTGVAGAGKQYLDSVYVDDSLHRVIISESATFAGITDSQPQIPMTWNNTQINIECRAGVFDFAGVNPLYLYVVDGDGVQINTAGELIYSP